MPRSNVEVSSLSLACLYFRHGSFSQRAAQATNNFHYLYQTQTTRPDPTNETQLLANSKAGWRSRQPSTRSRDKSMPRVCQSIRTKQQLTSLGWWARDSIVDSRSRLTTLFQSHAYETRDFDDVLLYTQQQWRNDPVTKLWAYTIPPNAESRVAAIVFIYPSIATGAGTPHLWAWSCSTWSKCVPREQTYRSRVYRLPTQLSYP